MDSDVFEFLASADARPMCAADDVFLGGKLLPFGAPPPKRAEMREKHYRRPEAAAAVVESEGFDSAAGSACIWSGGGRMKAEYRRLRRIADTDVKFPATGAAKQQQRSRWHLWVLGSVRVPATMDMSEIRSRQRRRSSGTKAESGEAVGCDANRCTWKLLRSLSCKGMESALVVKEPLGFISHVQKV